MDQDGTWHGGGPRSRPHCTRWGRSSPSPKGGTAPQFSAHFYCGQTARCIRIPLGTEVGLSPGDIVLDGDSAAPPLKGHSPPIFGPRLLWPNGCMDQDATWYGGRPQPMENVLDGDPATPEKKPHPPPPNFLDHVYCGQTAGWMKMPLGTEVDLGSGHIVLDGVPALCKRGTAAPVFGPCLLWPRSPISATTELL